MTQEFIRSIYGKTDHPGFTVIIGKEGKIKEVGTYSQLKIAREVASEFVGKYDVIIRDEKTGNTGK